MIHARSRFIECKQLKALKNAENKRTKFKNSTEHITESDSDTESPDNCDEI